MDYLVRDDGYCGHAIVEAPSPIDAVQRYIDIARRKGYDPAVTDLSVYPITRKNTILKPVDVLNGDHGC